LHQSILTLEKISLKLQLPKNFDKQASKKYAITILISDANLFNSPAKEILQDTIIIQPILNQSKLTISDFRELKKFSIDELNADPDKILLFAGNAEIKDTLTLFQKHSQEFYGFIFANDSSKINQTFLNQPESIKAFFIVDMKQKENPFLVYAERLALCNSNVKIGYNYSNSDSILLKEKFLQWLNSNTSKKSCNSNRYAKPLRILFFGDSLVISFTWIFNANLNPEYFLEVDNFGKVSSGLVVSNFYNWNNEIKKILHTKKYDLAVFLIGANDDKGISIQDIFFPFGSKEWKILYEAKYNSMIAQLIENKIVPILVTLPPVQSKLLNQKYSVLNQIFRSVSEKYNFPFLDLPKFLGDRDQNFVSSLSFRDKKSLMRVDDGVHFTKLGAELMSQKLLELIYQ
jgi:lysophospholipase L1-like esterase